MKVKYTVEGTDFEIDVTDLGRTVTKEERQRFQEKYPGVKAWIQRKAEGTSQYMRHLIVYCEEITVNGKPMTPQTLLDLKSDYGDMRAETLLESHQTEVNRVHGVRYKGRIFGISSEFNLTVAIKAWYTFNGKALAKGRATYYYKRVRKKPQFTKEDLVVFASGEPRNFRAYIGLASSLPARIGTILELDWYHVREVLDESIEYPHVDIEPELLKRSLMEKGLHQHGFIHNWARKLLLEWKDEYEELAGGKIDLADEKSLNQPLFIGLRSKKRLSHSGVEKWFRDRSKETGIKITPHSFRAYVKDALECSEDMKAVFLAQSGRHDRAYTRELVEKLREASLKATLETNPLFKDKFESSRKVLKEKFSGRLTEEEIQWIGQRMSLGLLTMEEKFQNMKDEFLANFLERVATQLERR